MNTENMGRQIAMFRKERGLTQEALANILSISAQAISKWENGHSLPDTALLPGIACALDCTIDSLFSMSDLVILDAWYGDGIKKRNVTTRLTRYIENNTLRTVASPDVFGGAEECGRVMYLTVKYRNLRGVFYAYAKQNDVLSIDAYTEGAALNGEKLRIIAAVYGNSAMYTDVMKQLKHYSVFNWSEYRADDEMFPSDPMNDRPEYLTLVYINHEGINVVTCEEGERIAYNAERTDMFRKNAGGKVEAFIHGIGYLPPYRKGRECSLIASLAAAAEAVGIKTSYERLMGASGAGFMFAFASPQWDYTAADGILPFDYSPAAYRALGYKCTSAGKIDKHGRGAERRKIINDLRQGIPVLAINLSVDNAWGVICGYRERAENKVDLFCRTKYDLELESLSSRRLEKDCITPDDYAHVDNWPSNLIYFAGQISRPDERQCFMQAMKQFIDCFALQRNNGYYLGRNAFEKFRDDLLDDDWYERAEPGQFARRFSVAQFTSMCLKDARSSALIYLKESRGLLCDTELVLLDELIAVYKEVCATADKMFGMIDTADVLEGDAARRVWTAGKRHSQAEMIGKLIGLESRAFETAKKFEGIKEVR